MADDLGELSEAEDGTDVGAGADGGFGADDTDEWTGVLGGGIDGGASAGVDDSGDGEGGELCADGLEGECGGGVAGEDDVFGVVGLEVGEDFADEGGDGVSGFWAVGDSGGVAEVEDVLEGEDLAEGADDGEAAEAAVKDDDWGGWRGHVGSCQLSVVNGWMLMVLVGVVSSEGQRTRERLLYFMDS